MKSTSPLIAAVALAAWATAATAALAQSSDAMVPNPANPFPANPIATDGTSLRSVWSADTAGSDTNASTRGELQALQPSVRPYRR